MKKKLPVVEYEVRTIYKSGRETKSIYHAPNEKMMWELYNKHHDASKVVEKYIYRYSTDSKYFTPQTYLVISHECYSK